MSPSQTKYVLWSGAQLPVLLKPHASPAWAMPTSQVTSVPEFLQAPGPLHGTNRHLPP